MQAADGNPARNAGRLGVHRRGRWAAIDLRASAFGGFVVILAAAGAWLYELAEGRDGDPYGQLLARGRHRLRRGDRVTAPAELTGVGFEAMEQRVSVITLGVRDLARARAFYEALGWVTRAKPDDDVVFFQAGGLVFALWGRDQLAEDSVVEDAGGWGGVTLSYNVRAPEDVDSAIEEARAAGANIVREPAETFWGGYSAAFTDPEGHPWEVAHNPRWAVADDGSVKLPPG